MSLKESVNTKQSPEKSSSLNSFENFSSERIINLLHSVGIIISPSATGLRHKIKKTYIKSLWAIARMHFHNEKKGRRHNFFGITRLADWAKVSERSFKGFTASPEYAEFGIFVGNAWISNEYFLADDALELFRLFKDAGMMRGIETNFDNWLKIFKKRLAFCITLAEEGKSIEEIRKILCSKVVVNKLSTGNEVKLPTEPALNCPLSHPCGIHPNASNDSVQSRSLFQQRFKETEDYLVKYGLQGADLYNVLQFNSPLDLDRGIKVLQSWMRNGFRPTASKVGSLMTCINISRKRKRLTV